MITSLNTQASGLILAALECTKCVFGRALPWIPLEELTALPRPLAVLRGLLQRGGERRKVGKGVGRQKNGTGGAAPLCKFLGPPLNRLLRR